MNEVERSIYNDGELIKKKTARDEAGNTITQEFIKCDREIFEFSF